MRRTLGMTGMILAVLGVLLCIGLIVGSWYGRWMLNVSIREMLPSVDMTLEEGTDLLDRADLVLENASEGIGGARVRLRTVVGNNTESIAAVTSTVENVVTTVAEPVRTVRNELAALRGSIILFTTFFNGLPSFLGLPDIPTERLEEIDERARAIDSQITAIETAVSSTQENVSQTRTNVNNSLDTLQSQLTTLSATAATFSGELTALQRALPAIQSRANLIATLFALFLTLLSVCGVALFANLYYDAQRQWEEEARQWVKTHTTSTSTETTSKKVNGGEVVTTTVTVMEKKGRRLAETELETA